MTVKSFKYGSLYLSVSLAEKRGGGGYRWVQTRPWERDAWLFKCNKCLPTVLQNIGKKMTCQEFINNLDGLNEGQEFPRELLKVGPNRWFSSSMLQRKQ